MHRSTPLGNLLHLAMELVRQKPNVTLPTALYEYGQTQHPLDLPCEDCLPNESEARVRYIAIPAYTPAAATHGQRVVNPDELYKRFAQSVAVALADDHPVSYLRIITLHVTDNARWISYEVGFSSHAVLLAEPVLSYPKEEHDGHTTTPFAELFGLLKTVCHTGRIHTHMLRGRAAMRALKTLQSIAP